MLRSDTLGTPNANWWNSFYDDVAMVVLEDQDPDTIKDQVDVIQSLTGLSEGQHVMDQCCGVGQHACEIADRSINVVAIDQSSPYIDRAKLFASERGVAASFVVADALEYEHHLPVDVVYNWHSSFGYFNDDAMNQRMLQSALRSLRPGGTMLLEFPNMLHLLANFNETIHSTHPGGVRLTRKSRISAASGTLHQTWIYEMDGQPTRTHESVLRIYLPDQLIRMFCDNGFDEVRATEPSGDELSRTCPRTIITGRRRNDG